MNNNILSNTSKYLILLIFLNHHSVGQICDNNITIATTPHCNYNPYVLVFEDQFNGKTLDLGKWNIREGYLRNPTSEKQWYSKKNIEVSNGTLKITAKEENQYHCYTMENGATGCDNFTYTSAEIDTKHQYGFGKYEIRCKIPKGLGLWPAFWTYAYGASSNDEVDVFEFMDQSNASNPQFNEHHYGNQCATDYNGTDYSTSFHTFTIIWDFYRLDWYIDGTLRRRSTRFWTRTYPSQQIICENVQSGYDYYIDTALPIDPGNIITNLAIQTGQSAPNSNTAFPAVFEIDYIKYYQQISCSGIVNITNNSQLNYGAITGTTINLNTDVSLSSDQSQTLVSRDAIIITPNVLFDKGSNFLAEINSTICSGTARFGYLEESPNTDIYIKSQDSIFEQNIINIYPSPTTGKITIESKSLDQTITNIEVADIMGTRANMVVNKESNWTVDISNNRPGIYILKVIFGNNVIKKQIVLI